MLRVRNELIEPESTEDLLAEEVMLARKIRLGEQFQNVAGVSIVYGKPHDGHVVGYCVAQVLSTSTWRPVAEQKQYDAFDTDYDSPWRPVQEAHLMTQVLQKLHIEPDLIFVSGNGIAHPRKFGLASRVGYMLDHPTIGVSPLWPPGCGQTHMVMVKNRGARAAIKHDPSLDHVGSELYTHDNQDPIYVSPGHRVSVSDAAAFALRCAPIYRLPEPIRRSQEAALSYQRSEEE